MIRSIVHLAWLLVMVPLSSAGDGPTLEQRLDTAIQRELEALAKGPRLKLPQVSEPSDVQPPPSVVEAGEEFVMAWRTWHRISSLPKPPPKDNHAANKIDAREKDHWEAFEKLLEQTLTGDLPPPPSEYERFTYRIEGWCGSNPFHPLYDRGHTLALLRSGDTYPVLQQYSEQVRNESSFLYTAYGIDPEDFAMGQWLNFGYDARNLLAGAKEKTALMLLKLAGQIADRPPQPAPSSRHQLYLEQWVLVDLLRPDSGISDTTKEKIANFIATKGSTYAPDYWISHTPKGAGKWMVPMARLGLQAKTNRTRKLSSRILTEAGIPHQQPEAIPPPEFRVMIDGQLWPADLKLDSLSVALKYSKDNPGEDGSFNGGNAFRLNSVGPGKFNYEADSFTAGGKIGTLFLHNSPFGLSGFQSPQTPWIIGSPALPLKFGEVNEVNIETTQLTIRPVLPKTRLHDVEHPIEIDLDWVNGEDQPRGVQYRVNADESLVLPRVSVGEYWVRVRYPGAALMPWTRYKVSKEQNMISPELEFGATIIVPIKGPTAEDLKDLPVSLSYIKNWGNFDSLAKIEPVAKDYRNVTPDSDETRKHLENSIIFSNLPPGNYEISVPEKTETAVGTQDGCTVQAASISVTIDDKSPVFVITKQLGIRITVHGTKPSGQ